MRITKKLILFAVTVLAASGLLTGCTGVQNTISPALVRQGVAVGVSYSVIKYPQAIPGVKIGREVICSAATGNDISPSNIVVQIQATGNNQLSGESVLIINTALLLYTGVWNSYGNDAVNNRPVLKGYLEATCNGITDGLGASSQRALAVEGPEGLSGGVTWPLVR